MCQFTNKTGGLLCSLLLCMAAARSQQARPLRDSLSLEGERNEVVLHAYSSAVRNYVKAMSLDATSEGLDTFWLDYSRAENMFFYLGNYPQALKLASLALQLARQHSDGRRSALALNTLGYIYFHQQHASTALAYFDQYLRQSRLIRDTNLMLDAVNNMAELRLRLDQDSLALRELDRALAAYGARVNHSVVSYSRFLQSTALEHVGRLGEAEAEIRALVNDPDSNAQNLYDRVRYLLLAARVERHVHPSIALQYARRAQGLAIRIRHVEDMQAADQTLAELFGSARRFDSAYKYTLLASAIRDSLLQQRNDQTIQELYTEQDLDRQNRAILLRQSRLNRQIWLRNLWIALILLILLGVWTFLRMRQLRQKAAYQRQLSQHQNDMYRLVLHKQEADRQRLSQDLHDGIGSLLSASRMHLAATGETSITNPSASYLKGLDLLDEAAGQLRVLAQQSMPASLKREGLAAALKGVLDSAAIQQQLQVEFSTHGLRERLDVELELHVYRIVMELVHNALKHARAQCLSVQLICHQGILSIVVEDDGVGMERDRLPAPGMGLENVQARVLLLQGSWQLDSQPGQGTTVTIELPLYG